jgi:hypothetical protein
VLGRVHLRLAVSAVLAASGVHCSDGAGAAAVDEGAEGDAGSRDGAGSADDDGSSSSSAGCSSSAEVSSAIGSCLDDGGAPRVCLARARLGDPDARCDVDGDGLDDALEDAMMRSYAPVFAYNLGDDGHTAGSTEPAWPASASHFVAHSRLVWRVDADESTRRTVQANPLLDQLPSATFQLDGGVRTASSPKLGQGPNFWLCLDRDGGQYAADALVPTMESSRTLADGIDVFAVVHPTSTDPNGRYVALAYMLLYPYNRFTFDDHEGDWEGGAVFVDMDTGGVVALYTDRHPSADGTKIIPLTGAGALPAKDPNGEAAHYNVCSDTSTSAIGGVRFWDFAGKEHHPVIYVAAGGHASYGYPGATKITGIGCIESTIIRDVHNGNGGKLVPHEASYYSDWGETKTPVAHGVKLRNLGEQGQGKKLRETWSAFAGQWGCTLDDTPKSYPGPWDNERLCRHWLTNDWGVAPPFRLQASTGCAN